MLAYGRRIPKAEMFARIDAVDADTVRGVADRFIYDQVEYSLPSPECAQLSPDGRLDRVFVHENFQRAITSMCYWTSKE